MEVSCSQLSMPGELAYELFLCSASHFATDLLGLQRHPPQQLFGFSESKLKPL